MSSHPTPSPIGLPGSMTFPAGTVVGGRFLIERHHASDPLGELLLARDQKTNKPIALRLLAPHIAGAAGVLDAIKSGVRAAAKLKHRSILATYGIGTHESRAFVASEWVQGHSLSEQIAERAAAGGLLSVRGSYNVAAHLCKALAETHATMIHGALRPEIVWVTRAGRVKLGEVGLCEAARYGARWLDPVSQACLAPELLAGEQAGPATDVYGVGALLQLMLTGAAPSEPLVPPSSVHPDATPELDAIVAQCLAPDPSQRFARIEDVAQALLPLVATSPEPVSNEFGVDLEIDVDIATSLAPPARRPSPAPVRAPSNPLASNPLAANPLAANPLAPNPLAAAPQRPQQAAPAPAPAGQAPPPQRLPAAPPQRPSTPDPFVARPAPAAAPAPPPKPQVSLEQELSTLMTKLTEDDAPRWMAVKDGLDHGPFTARELIKLIVDGEVREQHGLLNMSTGERKPLAEWRELVPFVEQFRLRKAEADHAVALEKSKRVERGSNVAKFLILGGSIALLVFAGGGYLMSRQAAKKRQEQNLDLAAMFESGKVKISGTAGILHAPPGHRGGGGSRRSSGGGDGTGFSSYDDAMNQAMELGDATKGGGERQLPVSDIQAAMDRKLNSMFGCVGQELRSGGHLGSVQINLAILGSGQVMGASVSAGSSAFKKCIVGKVRQITFPSFPAPRMGARYSFDVN